MKKEIYFYKNIRYDEGRRDHMLKEKLLDYLKNQTSFFNPENVSDIFQHPILLKNSQSNEIQQAII